METPAYRLEVDPLDLGADVKAVGLELLDPENREPLRGAEAARVWGAVIPALAGTELWALDFFSHLERLRAYCGEHGLPFREAASRCIVVAPPGPESLVALLARFEGETFGLRAGGLLQTGDAALEGGLSCRGVDAYHHAYPKYFFCGVCDFENGFLTLLTDRLWATEVIRRLRPVLERFSVAVARSE